jgi:hypothetical protein
MIEAAAIKTSDGKVWVVPKPGRHDSCFKAIADGISYRIETPYETETEAERKRWLDYVRDHVQGFVTDRGEFLDRAQSYEHAKAVGQLEIVVKGALVDHAVHGQGRVLEAKGEQIHVRFDRRSDLFSHEEGGKRLWVAKGELERALLGSVLTSEDLW